MARLMKIALDFPPEVTLLSPANSLTTTQANQVSFAM